MSDGREHLAVLLRRDEAAYLQRQSTNRASSNCCPHLDVFHNNGTTRDGDQWRSCQVAGCMCHSTAHRSYVEKLHCYSCGKSTQEPPLINLGLLAMMLMFAVFGFVIGVSL